jgi:nitrite reductase (NO-forming)
MEIPVRHRSLTLSSILVIALGGGALAVTAASRNGMRDAVYSVDFAKTVRATSPAFDARLAPAADAPVKNFRIPITDATIEIAKGVTYQGWTFGGTVPGPVLRVRVGDVVHITVVNQSAIPHSIDFRAARIPANVAYRMIMPKDSISFAFEARAGSHGYGFLARMLIGSVATKLLRGASCGVLVVPPDAAPDTLGCELRDVDDIDVDQGAYA